MIRYKGDGDDYQISFQQKSERIKKFKKEEYADQQARDRFFFENPGIKREIRNDKPVIINSPNREIIEARKKEYGITNADVVDSMNTLAGTKIISVPTLQRKLSGQGELTSLEMRLISEILNLSPVEILLAFNLISQIDLHMYLDDNGYVHPQPVSQIKKIKEHETEE